MTAPGLTSSQTVGPFFSGALLREDARRNVLVGPETAGERIRIEGTVYDGDNVSAMTGSGAVTPGAWQMTLTATPAQGTASTVNAVLTGTMYYIALGKSAPWP